MKFNITDPVNTPKGKGKIIDIGIGNMYLVQIGFYNGWFAEENIELIEPTKSESHLSIEDVAREYSIKNGNCDINKAGDLMQGFIAGYKFYKEQNGK